MKIKKCLVSLLATSIIAISTTTVAMASPEPRYESCPNGGSHEWDDVYTGQFGLLDDEDVFHCKTGWFLFERQCLQCGAVADEYYEYITNKHSWYTSGGKTYCLVCNMTATSVK